MFDRHRCTVPGCRYSSNTPRLAINHIVRHEAERERLRSERAKRRRERKC